jgi:predicted DNA-binding transcriptional regulator AlpA
MIGEEPKVGHGADERSSSDAYLPLPQLSSYAGLSVRTLHKYLTHPAHPLPCYRIGGRVLVRKSEYDSWAARFRSVSPSTVDRLVSEALRGL